MLALPYFAIASLIPTDLGKRQTQTFTNIDQCPQMLQKPFPWGARTYPDFVASYCSKTSVRDWNILCGSPPTSLESYDICTHGTGTCRPHERCWDGPLQDGFPRASCVAEESFVRLATTYFANYHRINQTDSTYVNGTSSSSRNMTSKLSTSYQGRPRTKDFTVTARNIYHNWFTCFVTGRSSKKLIKARSIAIGVLDESGAPTGPPEWCRNCKWLTYAFPSMYTNRYRVHVILPRGSERVAVSCVQGVS